MRLSRLFALLQRVNLLRFAQRIKTYFSSKASDANAASPMILQLEEKLEVLCQEHALKNFPCHLLIGLSGAGKTTLLQKGGMNFPLLSNTEKHSAGLGGTSGIDIWPSDHAMILDINGELMDYHQHQQTWEALLTLLNKYKRCVMLKSIVVVISCEDLNTEHHSIGEGCDYVNNLKQIISAVYKAQPHMLPVNILLSQCDKLAGFNEYFSGLSELDKQQIIGVSNVDDAQLETALQNIHHIFEKQSLFKLSNVKDLQSKHNVYQFPVVIKNVIANVLTLCDSLKRINAFHVRPQLEGIYFSAIDENAYFTKSLLPTHIFNPNKKLISNTTHQRKQARQYQCALALATCLVLGGWYKIHMAYAVTKKVYVKGLELISNMQNNNQHTIVSLYEYYESLEDYQKNTAFTQRLGLFQVAELKQVLAESLVKFMHQEFLVTVAHYLEQKLQACHKLWKTTANQTNELRGHYHQYQQYYQLLARPENIDIDVDAHIYAYFWHEAEEKFKLPMMIEMVKLYFSNLLEQSGSLVIRRLWSMDSSLINLVHEDLKHSEKTVGEYAMLRANALILLGNNHTRELPTLWRNNYDVPVMFTPKGWQEHIKHHINKSMYAQYTNEYKQRWCRFLSALTLHPANSLTEVIHMLTTITEQQQTNNIIAMLNKNKINKLVEFPETNKINDYFPQYYQQLNKLNIQLEQLSASHNTINVNDMVVAVLNHEQTTAFESLTISIRKFTNTLDDPQLASAIQHVLLAPVKTAWQQLLRIVSKDINNHWNESVYDYYKESIANKFPFHHQNYINSFTNEIALNDFNDFFQPGDGMLWQFTKNKLSSYLEYQNNSWVPRQWLGVGVGFSKEFLQQLNNANTITKIFFSRGGELKFNYQIRMLSTPGVSSQRFNTDAQHYLYRNEPEAWRDFTWPSTSTNVESELILNKVGNKQYQLNYAGPWGVLQLLTHARLTQLSHGLFRARWYLKNTSGQRQAMTILFRKSGRHNIFDAIIQHSFKRFILPRNIMKQQRSVE